jgi:hypothetical protein
MFTIIVKDSKPRGSTRTKTDQVLIDSGWGSSFKSEQDADKCAFLERKLKDKLGADDSRVTARLLNQIPD